MKQKILIIEDQKRALSVLVQGLTEAGFETLGLRDGKEGLSAARTWGAHAILLDLGLPSLGGLELLSALRKEGHLTPVLILTAKDRVEHRVQGLDAGADDYLIKPFAFAELCARIRSLLRRYETVPSDPLKMGPLELNAENFTARLGGKPLMLTPREFSLLRMLISRPGQPVARSEMMRQVWNLNFESDTNIVDVAVSRLRDKLVDAGYPSLVVSVRGVGYKAVHL